MKILIVHNLYKSNIIGGEDLVFDNEKTALMSVLGLENVLSYQVSNDDTNFTEIARNVFYSRKHYKHIYEIVLNNKIDIVHVHNYFPLLSVSIFKAAKDAGAKVINTLHNYRMWCINGMLFDKRKGVCHDCIERNVICGVTKKCYRNSYLQSLIATLAYCYYRSIKYDIYIDKYFVLTDFQKNMVIKLGINIEKICLKPNYVKDKKIPYNSNKEGFIFVGRLEESKGIIQLIDTWKTFDNGYKLKIIGTGPLKKFIEKLDKENIIYLGKKSNQETLEEISKSKYLLQTSLWYETFGLTIVEAFSVGTPVIGYNIGTRKNFIVDNSNGFLCSQNELRNTIIKANYYDNYAEMSSNSIKTFAKYKEEVIIKKQIELYSNIINGAAQTIDHANKK